MVEWVKKSEWNKDSLYFVLPQIVDVEGLKDPGIGGPCLYRDILTITIPRHRVIKETRNGSPYRQDRQPQPIADLLEDFQTLGKLPVDETAEFIQIIGYKE